MEDIQLNLSGKTARTGNKLLNRIIWILLLLFLFFCLYALYDTWRVLHGANDSRLKAYRPGGELGLEELIKINPDVCAWLTIDDTHIDYPVVRGFDNMEYLDLNPLREFYSGGSIFLDYRNSKDFTDGYSILFGHHMAGGAMFTDVLEFRNEKFFNSHTTGTLFLPGNIEWSIELFAFMEVDAYDGYVYTPVITGSTETIRGYIADQSTYYRDLGLTDDDRIIAMSTCTEAMGNLRGVLFGRVVYK